MDPRQFEEETTTSCCRSQTRVREESWRSAVGCRGYAVVGNTGESSRRSTPTTSHTSACSVSKTKRRCSAPAHDARMTRLNQCAKTRSLVGGFFPYLFPVSKLPTRDVCRCRCSWRLHKPASLPARQRACACRQYSKTRLMEDHSIPIQLWSVRSARRREEQSNKRVCTAALPPHTRVRCTEWHKLGRCNLWMPLCVVAVKQAVLLTGMVVWLPGSGQTCTLQTDIGARDDLAGTPYRHMAALDVRPTACS